MIMRTAEEQASNFAAMAVRIEPRLELPVPRLLRSFGRAPLDLIPTNTLYLDLQASEEDLLSRMHPKGRYNIRLSERNGVKVTESRSVDHISRFYPLLLEAARRDDFFVEPFSFFVTMAEQLLPSGMARLLFAEHEGQILGSLLLITFGSRATYLYGAVSNCKRNLMAGYALQWNAMRLAKRLGCTVYDFYGYEPSGDPGHQYSRFSRFKQQFGGQIKRFIGAHDFYFIDRLADVMVRTINELSLGAAAPAQRS